MNFERGIDPKEAIGLGHIGVLESMEGCLLVTEKDLYQNVTNKWNTIDQIQLANIRKETRLLYNSFLIIIVLGENFRIVKNRFITDVGVYPIEKLPELVFELKKHYDTWIKERRQ